jgi:hypothetical protein
MSSLTQIVGKTPTKVSQTEDSILIHFSDNSAVLFYHEQDCCESVVVDDVNGNWEDLFGNPLLVADERDSGEVPDGSYGGEVPAGSYGGESNTWTFYTFRGIGGSVDVRWHGSSNGYYSESVNIHYESALQKKRKTND